jgi:long-subunit fatty acid transport protein
VKARAPLAALLLVALAAAPASAQASAPPPARTPKRGGGLWVDAGVGYGHLRLTCATCSTVVAASGRAVTVSAGFTPAQNVLLGLQAQQWSSTGGPLAQRVSSLIAVVQWYPWPARGFFMRAGNGIVRGPGASQAAGAQPAPTQGTGVGFALGVGYDIKVNRRFGLTVQAATDISALGDLTVNGQPADDVIAYVTRIGVAVVLR